MEEKEEQIKTTEEASDIVEDKELTYEQLTDNELEGNEELEDWGFD